MADGIWQTADGRRQTAEGRWQTADGRRQTGDDDCLFTSRSPLPSALRPPSSALRPPPSPLCLMPYALCHLPSAFCQISHRSHFTPYALRPPPYALGLLPSAVCHLPYLANVPEIRRETFRAYMSIKQTATSILLLLFVQLSLFAQDLLPRSTPEKQGVSSAAITTFIDSITSGKNELHSFMFLRHGKVIAEGWWHPYRPDLKHTMYSVSKSFTATAVGFAVKENKLRVNDKVISFFPDQLPDTISQYLRDLTVKDLLTMTVGQDPDPTSTVNQDSNWIRRFLATPIVNQPGTRFLYNSAGTYMLSAIVQKVTGQTVLDYLTPRLFQPLGIEGVDWETDPSGINVGGWGLRLKTEDMARFGQMFLQRGKWKRKRLLSKSWVKDASSAKIIQNSDKTPEQRANNDWEQGYGYQMWRSRHNSYRADGAFGQYILILPEKDAVIVITSETPDMPDELNAVWKFLVPAMKKKKLPDNEEDLQTLKQQLNDLFLPVSGNSNTSSQIDKISGTTYRFGENAKGIKAIRFNFENNICNVSIDDDKGTHNIGFGLHRWNEGETGRHGPYLVAKAQNSLEGLPPFKVAAQYSWRDDNKLSLVLRYIESPHTEYISCVFDGNNVQLEFRNSFSNQPVVITGERSAQ